MYIFFFILLLTVVFLIALFTVSARVTLNLDTDENMLSVKSSWLIQTASVQFLKKESRQKVSIFFSGKRIASWNIRLKPKAKKRRRGLFYVRALSMERARCKTAYGFSTPFLTGISSGFPLFIQSIVPNISIEMTPDFFSDHAYLIVRAEAKLNLGRTILNLIRKRPDKRSEKHYGPIGNF